MMFMFLLNLLRIYDMLFYILDKLVNVTALQIPYELLRFNSFICFVAGTAFFKIITKLKRKPLNTKEILTFLQMHIKYAQRKHS